MYGGGKGGGKSVLFCLWVDYWVQFLIEYFDLKPTSKNNHLPLGFIGRKQGVDFKLTTLETFKRIIPQDHYRIREQEKEIIFFECAKIYFGGLDDKLRINKFNSAEFAFLALDQAEETERTDVDVLQGTLRLTHKGKIPPYKELYTANPGECWLKEDFIDNKVPHKHFVPALHSDNPHLPPSYADRLRNTFKYNPALLAAYLDGNWYSLQATNALVSSRQLQELKDVYHHWKDVRGVVACDPSLGGDECVIYAIKNYKIEEMMVLHERDTMKIAGHMAVIGAKHGIPNYAADTTGGLGNGILDRIRELDNKNNCIYVNSSDGASNPEAYANLKMEVAWYFMARVIEKELPPVEDEELRTQILAQRFKVLNSQGKTIMEDKMLVKKRLGRSPDRSDAYFIGVWAQDQCGPIKPKDSWRDKESNREVGGGSDSAMTA